MKRISHRKLALALATGSMMAMAPSAAQAAPKKKAQQEEQRVPAPTKAYAEGYNSVVKPLQAGDFAAAKTAFDASVGSATAPNDMYWAGNLALQLGGKLNDQALQRRGINMVLDSGLASPEEKSRYSFFEGQFAYQAKDYARAAEMLQQAYDAGYRDNNIAAVMAEAYNNAGDNATALKWLNTAIENQKAAGQAVDQNWYKRGAALALQAKNNAAASDWLGRLVSAYPTATNWRDTLIVYRDGANLTTPENLDLMRLMRQVGALKSERDYGEYIEALDPRRFPGEVVAVIDEAGSNGLSNSTFLNEQRGIAQGNIAADKAGLPSAAKDARTAANGKIAASTADAYMGYGDYAKAADLYSVALEKGGVDADMIHTRRGIALAEMGDKAAALAEFDMVNGGNRAAIANYWKLYLNNGVSAEAAATAS